MKRRTKQRSMIQELGTEAIRRGADMIEVEYDEGYEDVYLRKDNVGITVARFKASSSKAMLLKKELYGLTKKKQRIAIENALYEFSARVYDSFGEDAFRVQLRRVYKGSPRASR